MRIAYIYNDKDVYAEFSDEKFRDLLKKYIEKYGDIDRALDQIVTDLKEAIKRQ